MGFRYLLGTIIPALIAGPIFAADLVPVRSPLGGPGVPTLMIVSGIMCVAIWLPGKAGA
jgi:hypothetical protein